MPNLTLREAVMVMNACSLDEKGLTTALTKMGYGKQLNEGLTAASYAADDARKIFRKEHPRFALTFPTNEGIEGKVFTAYAEQWIAANEQRFKDGIEVSAKGAALV